MSATLPTPDEMIAHLDRFVFGQESAKRDLAVAVYNHYLGVRYAETPEAKFRDLDRQHVLLIGPTGSGKTYLLRTLAGFLGVPVATASATSFAETGYVGDHVTSLLQQLLSLTNNDVARAQRGIVFIDEFDKIKRSAGGGRDVSGEGVQAGLLTLLDGVETTIRQGSGTATMDVSKVLFICSGAFAGLAEIIRHRLADDGPARFGFSPTPLKDLPEDLSEDSLLARCETRDLEKFGMIPELIGRFNTITALQSLTKRDLVAILTDVEGSPLAKRRLFWNLHGIDLVFEDAALEEVALAAERLATGARGLKRIVDRALKGVDYRITSLAAAGITRVEITQDTVRSGKPPRLESNRVTSHHADAPPSVADTLRRSALAADTPQSEWPESISATDDWTEEETLSRLEFVKRRYLDWEHATQQVYSWWKTFEIMNSNHHGHHRAVLKIAEELMIRRATIADYYRAAELNEIDKANWHLLHYDTTDDLSEESDGYESLDESILDFFDE